MALDKREVEIRLAVLAGDALWGYGLYQAITNMITNGISRYMLFAAVLFCACISPSLIIWGHDIASVISNIKNRKEKKEQDENTNPEK